MKNKTNEQLSWDRDVVPHTSADHEDSTFHAIVKQLGGGTWAESIAREIMGEGPAEGEEH